MTKATPEFLDRLIETFSATPKSDKELEDYASRPDKKQVHEEYLEVIGRWGYFKEDPDDE